VNFNVSFNEPGGTAGTIVKAVSASALIWSFFQQHPLASQVKEAEKEAAQLAGADANYDLAVLKMAVPQAGLSAATLGNSAQLQVGQEVLAIGNPLGETETVTDGIVSALKRTVSEGQAAPTIHNAIQTDAPINPGNSGGALVDLQGNVVGVPTLSAIDPEFNTPANGVGFAIPINRVKTILPQFIQG
jgi:S1-C subfamily serine protease